MEMQRVMQRYYCMVDGVVQGFGDLSGVGAPCDVVFELVDEGASSNTPATVLYDTAAATGTLPGSPATCAFAAVNSTQIFGSIRSVNVTRTGSAWVVSTLPNGTKQTRLIGSCGRGRRLRGELRHERGNSGQGYVSCGTGSCGRRDRDGAVSQSAAV